MRDLGNWQPSGNYTLYGNCDVSLFMDMWLDIFQHVAEDNGLPVLLGKEECKMPNVAREIGGVIGLIGKMASSTVMGYNIKDDSSRGNSKKKVLYDVYLVPRDIQGGTVVEAYVITYYGISLNRAERAMGEGLLERAGQILNETFNIASDEWKRGKRDD